VIEVVTRRPGDSPRADAKAQGPYRGREGAAVSRPTASPGRFVVRFTCCVGTSGAAVGPHADGREELVARGALEQLTRARLDGRQGVGVGVEADNDRTGVGLSYRRDGGEAAELLAPGEHALVSWAATTSPPPPRPAAPYARCATRTYSNSTRATRVAGAERTLARYVR
jgi:hypothetical protein